MVDLTIRGAEVVTSAGGFARTSMSWTAQSSGSETSIPSLGRRGGRQRRTTIVIEHTRGAGARRGRSFAGRSSTCAGDLSIDYGLAVHVWPGPSAGASQVAICSFTPPG